MRQQLQRIGHGGLRSGRQQDRGGQGGQSAAARVHAVEQSGFLVVLPQPSLTVDQSRPSRDAP
jgi:hypothetical protein